jgi:ribonucleoside-diphosphate reductase alpha chain
MSIDVRNNLLISGTVSYRTYAKFLSHLYRRETIEEIINRNMQMHLEKFGSMSKSLSRDIIKTYSYVHDLHTMPSMRGMQFAGSAIQQNNCRQYNCSFLNIDNIRAFGESLFLLLSGVGVGYSVQNRHISNLPKVNNYREEGTFVVHDSIIGWAEAVDRLFEAYMLGRTRPIFDLSKIRPKGSYLVTTGAKAPGPEPLRQMLEKVEAKLKKARGRKLSSIEVHDIICIISDCVLAGGIRRAALISLFDRDDNDMLTCKSGEWWNEHPYRARANNSAVLPRNISKKEFFEIFDITRKSGSGEPGFSWSNNFDMGFNPCHEIALNSTQFCNLTTMNVTGVKDKKDFLKRCHATALLGTLQAAYTDFPYLRQCWKETTEREALLGCSMTGIADNGGKLPAEWLRDGAKHILELNQKYANKIGINPAARVTAIKPEGSSSCVLGSSSGIHDRHAEYYLRRVRINKDDALYKYFLSTMPELCEDDLFSQTGGVFTIPQRSPEGAVIREKTSAIKLLERAMFFNRNWVAPGHRTGDNKHNVSLTVSVRENEWEEVAEFMYNNRNLYSGISLLPYDGGTYKQAPFEEIDENKYLEYSQYVKDFDFKEIIEDKDYTNKIETIACGGGACEIV